MRIIKRAATGPHKFEVIRAFNFKPNQVVKPGEIIEIENVGEQVGLCQRGKVRPLLPATAVYIALTSFILPGKSEKFEAKKLELVELRAEDALPLLLERKVIPQDDAQWRPFDSRLKKEERRDR